MSTMSEMSIWDAVKAGEITPDEVFVIDPKFYVKYRRTIERLNTISMRNSWRTEMTKGIWLVGRFEDSTFYNGYNPETHFVKTIDNQWWDGYKQQDTVILNHYIGKIDFNNLFALVDKWPHTVKVKNRESVQFNSKRVIVCSVSTPEECHSITFDSEDPRQWDQFLRRFEVIHLTPSL